MSHWSDYQKETGGAEFFEQEWGFFSYRIFGDEQKILHVEDFYIRPEDRHKGIPYKCLGAVKAMADEIGAGVITGTVRYSNPNIALILRMHLKLGLVPFAGSETEIHSRLILEAGNVR